MHNLNPKDWQQGNGYISPNRSKFFVMVPKNASSTIIYALHNNGWQQANFNNVESDEYIFIQRDPFERWISGIIQYLLTLTHGDSESEIIEFLNSPISIKLIKKQLVFDGHTMPQSWFTHNLDPNKCKVFQFNRNVGESVLEYLGIDPNTRRINVTNEDPRKLLIKTHLMKWDFDDIKGKINE